MYAYKMFVKCNVCHLKNLSMKSLSFEKSVFMKCYSNEMTVELNFGKIKLLSNEMSVNDMSVNEMPAKRNMLSNDKIYPKMTKRTRRR